jgi:DNA-binding LytR/AlgR family response regulator
MTAPPSVGPFVGRGLSVLAVDDEAPALEDLTYLLARQHDVERVVPASDANSALRLLRAADFDVVFLDIRMPGLDGLDLARVLARFDAPPAVIFVSAFDEHAVEAFEVRAVDYLLKPVGELRLRCALERVSHDPGRAGWAAWGRTAQEAGGGAGAGPPGRAGGGPSLGASGGPLLGAGGGPSLGADAGAGPMGSLGAAGLAEGDDLAVVPVDQGGRVLLVERSTVIYVEAAGDYVRLHTPDLHYLVRLSMTTLEDRWARHGFVRIHRQYLVAYRHISELRTDGGASPTVVVRGRELPVSRRHAREVREVLVRSRRRVATTR